MLRPDTLATIIKGHAWQPAPPHWDAPLSAEDVRTSQYNGTVYLDAGSGTVILRVIDR
ncbi:hypothetical protein [Micromonospora sp. NPDC005189]|uniref:hypothetical protein n=1 Tax=Micromonospora sp. NPDC005189 TaxID=3157019 RepID=UPI0033B70287